MTAAVDLTGRMARCSYDQNTDATTGHTGRYEAGPSLKPSDPRLPFFEYLGPGSRFATETCGNCGYSEQAHDPERTLSQFGSVVEQGKCPGFEARGPADEDKYYCGACWGWD